MGERKTVKGESERPANSFKALINRSKASIRLSHNNFARVVDQAVAAETNARQAKEREHAEQQQAGGLDKAEFVVTTLVWLGCVNWSDAIPVMKHFDALDTNGSGRLGVEDLQMIAARAQANGPVQVVRHWRD